MRRNTLFGLELKVFAALLTFFAVAALVLLAFSVYLGVGKIMVLSGINVLLAILAFLLNRVDRLQLAGAFVSFGLLFTGFYAAWTTGQGIEDSAVVVLPVSCLMAAMLLTHRLLILQVFVAVAGTLVLGFRVELGLYEPAPVHGVGTTDDRRVGTALLSRWPPQR